MSNTTSQSKNVQAKLKALFEEMEALAVQVNELSAGEEPEPKEFLKARSEKQPPGQFKMIASYYANIDGPVKRYNGAEVYAKPHGNPDNGTRSRVTFFAGHGNKRTPPSLLFLCTGDNEKTVHPWGSMSIDKANEYAKILDEGLRELAAAAQDNLGAT